MLGTRRKVCDLALQKLEFYYFTLKASKLAIINKERQRTGEKLGIRVGQRTKDTIILDNLKHK